MAPPKFANKFIKSGVPTKRKKNDKEEVKKKKHKKEPKEEPQTQKPKKEPKKEPALRNKRKKQTEDSSMIKSVSNKLTTKRKRTKMNYRSGEPDSPNSSPEEDNQFLYTRNLRNRKFFSANSEKLSNALKMAVATVIPHVRACIEEEYRWTPFTEFPKWYSDYQDALDESWELIFKGGNQRQEMFSWDGGHVTIFLLAAEIDCKTFGFFKTYCSKRNPQRMAQIKDLDHKIKSLPCSSGTKKPPTPSSSTAVTPTNSREDSETEELSEEEVD